MASVVQNASTIKSIQKSSQAICLQSDMIKKAEIIKKKNVSGRIYLTFYPIYPTANIHISLAYLHYLHEGYSTFIALLLHIMPITYRSR